MLSAGLLLGGVGVAAATDPASAPPSGSATTTTAPSSSTTASSSAPETTTTTATSTTSETTTSQATTSAATTSETTTSETTSSETTTSEATTTAPTTTTTAPTTTTGEGTPPVSVAASRGCLGEIAVLATIPGLETGTPVTVVVDGLSTPAEVLEGGLVVVETVGLPVELTVLGVTVLVGDMAYEAQAPVAEVCTATGTIALVRDCATPDQVLAVVDVTGLADRVHGLAVVGVTESGQEVLLASADVLVSGGRLVGTLPLLSLGPVPVEGFAGIALVVDGATFASVAGNLVELASCVVPAPLPAAPPAPVVHPVASTTHAPTTAARPAPAQLATTGSETGSLLLLAGVFLVLGGLTTLAARRSARS